MSKYVPLQKYLARQSGEQTPLTFGEIERILGFPLPPSARKHAAWWSNNVGTHVGVRAWRDAGWKTTEVDQGSERVVFVRDHEASPRTSDDAIIIPRDLLAPATLRFLDQQATDQGDEAAAAANLLNAAAMQRRKLLMDRLSASAPRVGGDSADLIREDRDGR